MASASAHLPGTSRHTNSQDVEVPQFDLLPSKRSKDGEGKAKKGRARRAKAAAKTLLPEDHHYNVRRAGWAVDGALCWPQHCTHCNRYSACLQTQVQCTTSPVQSCRQCTKPDCCCSLATFLAQVDNLNRFALRPRNAMPTAGSLPGADGTAGGAAPSGAAGADEQQRDFQGDDAFDGFGGAGCMGIGPALHRRVACGFNCTCLHRLSDWRHWLCAHHGRTPPSLALPPAVPLTVHAQTLLQAAATMTMMMWAATAAMTAAGATWETCCWLATARGWRWCRRVALLGWQQLSQAMVAARVHGSAASASLLHAHHASAA